MTLWPEADNLSVAFGGLGGQSVGDEEAGLNRSKGQNGET